MESKMAVGTFKYYKHFPNTYTQFKLLYISDFNALLNTFDSHSEY